MHVAHRQNRKLPETEDDGRHGQISIVIRKCQKSESATTSERAVPISSDLRSQLRQQMPGYMVPSVLIPIQEIPLSATRKADRVCLREIGKVCISSNAPGDLANVNGTTTANRDDQDLILRTEQPAYELAHKISSMGTVWGSSNVSTKPADDGTRLRGYGFKDIMLHLAGLDSVNMISLKYYVSRHLKVTVSMRLLIDRTTSIRTLAKLIKVTQEQQDKDYVAINGSRQLSHTSEPGS